LKLTPADVVRIGLRRSAEAREGSRIRDNEIQDIFMARSDVSLGALVPFEDEVEALIALPIDDAARLFSGAIDRATGLTTAPGRPLPEPVEVRLDEFIPAEDGYYAQAMKCILELLAGRSPAPFTLG
jgi:hypothetical protein